MAMITGLVAPKGTSVVGVKGVWTFIVKFEQWRVDDGPLEQGELRASVGELSQGEALAFRHQAPAEQLVRLTADWDDETERWRLVEVSESAPNDDQELLDVFATMHRVPEPAKPALPCGTARWRDGLRNWRPKRSTIFGLRAKLFVMKRRTTSTATTRPFEMSSAMKTAWSTGSRWT